MWISPEELQEQALKVIRDSALSEYFDQLAPRLDFSIEIAVDNANDDDIPIGEHKLGGWPDVPPDFVWPTWNNEPLTFIAQFDLTALWPFDPKQLLPARGMLSFFSMLRPLEFEMDDFLMHGIIGSEPKTLGAWRVIYTPDSSQLERRVLPVKYERIAYQSQRVFSVSNSISLPDWCEAEAEDGVWDTSDFDLCDDTYDHYYQLRSTLAGLSEEGKSVRSLGCHLLGYANYYQGDKREEAAAFWNCATDTMRLLAQFSSSFGDDMSFAGDGSGYFFIEKNELASDNFARSHFGLQR